MEQFIEIRLIQGGSLHLRSRRVITHMLLRHLIISRTVVCRPDVSRWDRFLLYIIQQTTCGNRCLTYLLPTLSLDKRSDFHGLTSYIDSPPQPSRSWGEMGPMSGIGLKMVDRKSSYNIIEFVHGIRILLVRWFVTLKSSASYSTSDLFVSFLRQLV